MALKGQKLIMSAAFVAALAFAIVLVGNVGAADAEDDGLFVISPAPTQVADLEFAGMITGDITESITVEEGTYMDVLEEINLSKGVSITVEKGAALHMHPLIGLEINAEGDNWLHLKEGSMIQFMGQGTTENSGLTVSSDFDIGMEGTLSYQVAVDPTGGFSGRILIEVLDGTTVYMLGYELGFEGDTSLDMKIDVEVTGDLAEMMAKILAGEPYEINADLKMEITEDVSSIVVKSDKSIVAEISGMSYSEVTGKIVTDGTSTKVSGNIAGLADDTIAVGDMTISADSDIDMSFDVETGTEFTLETLEAVLSSLNGHVNTVFETQSTTDAQFSATVNYEIEGGIADGETTVTADGITYEDECVAILIDGLKLTDKGTVNFLSMGKLISYIMNLVPVSAVGDEMLPDLQEPSVGVAPGPAAIINILRNIIGTVEFEEDLDFECKALLIGYENDNKGGDILMNNAKITIDASSGNGLDLSASIVAKALRMDMKNTDWESSTIIATNVEADLVSDAEGNLSIDASLSATNQMFFGGALYSSKTYENLTFSLDLASNADLVYSYEGNIKELVGNTQLTYGHAKFDSTTGQLTSDSVLVQYAASSSNEELVQAKGVVTDFSAMTVGWSKVYDYSKATFVFTLKDGRQLNAEYTNDGETSVVCETNTDFDLETLSGFVAYNAIVPSPDQCDAITVNGDVRVIAERFNIETDLTGKMYMKNAVEGQEWTIYLSFEGIYLYTDGSGDLFIEAKEGFVLDPDTYEGFTADANGKITLTDEAISELAENGNTCISGRATGSTVKATLDGKDIEIVLGDASNINVSKSTMWIEDSYGRIAGNVDDGIWTYYADEKPTDLVFTSIIGYNVDLRNGEGSTYKNSFSFVVPEEVGSIFVKNGYGFMFGFEDTDYLTPEQRIMVKCEKVEMNGETYYDIDAGSPMNIYIPVESDTGSAYHYVNGLGLPMVVNYEEIDGQLYACVHASSYSLFQFDFDTSVHTSGYTHFFTAVVVVIIVLLVLGWMHVRYHRE